MKFYRIHIWEHCVSLKTLVWLASFSENSWEHYILRKPLLRKVRFYALVLPVLFVTKNVFFYSKKRRRRKKKLFSQWFSKKTLKISVFSCFSLKNHWFYYIYKIFKWFHWKHAGVALEVLILIHPYLFASTIFMNEAPGLVGLSFWIVSWFFVLVGSLVRHPMVFDNCFNQKLGCARLIRSELNSIHQFTWDHMIGLFSWELSVELPCVEQFFGKPTPHHL